MVEHDGGPDEATIDRIVKLGMILSIQRHIGPLRTQIERGMIATVGSDYPAFPNNPFVNIAIHITRKNAQGQVFDQSQKISREQALRMATINNAYLMFKEKKVGSIEAGKLADFVVLSADFMSVPEDRIRSLRAQATYVGGRKVFAREGSDSEGASSSPLGAPAKSHHLAEVPAVSGFFGAMPGIAEDCFRCH